MFDRNDFVTLFAWTCLYAKNFRTRFRNGLPTAVGFSITIKCVPPGKNQLCRGGTGKAVLSAMKHNHKKFVWHCRLCLLMPDHLHAIFAFPREPGMETAIKNWKKYVAGKHGVDWQRDFFDHRLRDHHELDEKTSYILLNPVRKGLCQRAADWVWIYRPNDRPPPRLG